MDDLDFFVNKRENILQPVFTFAVIGDVYNDGVTLIFPGQTVASNKRYKCNNSISFQAGDRVKVLHDSGTYVVEYVVGDPGGGGGGAQIAFGTYNGTGTYGSTNPTSLTFDFEPKFLWVTNGEALAGNYLGNSASSVRPYFQMMVLRNISKATLNVMNASTTATINITWNGNTVSWYSTYSDTYQLNKGSGYNTYTYFAIG